jgi:hypothetical protein
VAKRDAPAKVRKAPEIFILIFIMRRSCWARLLVKRTAKLCRKRGTSLAKRYRSLAGEAMNASAPLQGSLTSPRCGFMQLAMLP